ncbi:hypothetical protein BGZ65_004888, partial [Modicella reniformis]
MCSDNGLKFAERVVYVDRLTVRVVGKVLPHGPLRQGYPQISTYEKRRKAKIRTPGRDWNAELAMSGMTKVEIERNHQATGINEKSAYTIGAHIS